MLVFPVIKSSPSLRIGYVEQFTLKDSNLNVFEELLTIKQSLLDIESEIERIQKQIETRSQELSINNTISQLDDNLLVDEENN